MCFSAGASFTTSAVLATAGTATLRETRSKREWLLAAFPIIFSVHQCIEGALWLTIGKGQLQSLAHGLTLSYLLVAYCFWPVGAPAAVYLIEPNADRKQRLLPLLVLGTGISAYILYHMLLGHVEASFVHCSIAYDADIPHPNELTLLYAIAVLLPFFFSSYQPILVLGFINAIFCGVAYYLYHVTFHSVWCFFAAALSVNIYLFFRWLHQGWLRGKATSGE